MGLVNLLNNASAQILLQMVTISYNWPTQIRTIKLTFDSIMQLIYFRLSGIYTQSTHNWQ
jgi:hypothetical protein